MAIDQNSLGNIYKDTPPSTRFKWNALENFINIQKEINRELHILINLYEVHVDGSDTSCVLRIYYRSLWSLIEANINALKDVVLTFGHSPEDLQADDMLHLLSLNKKGKVNRSTKLEDNYDKTVKLFASTVMFYGINCEYVEFPVDLSFKRNDLVHPKSMADFDVTGEKLILAHDFADNLFNSTLDAVVKLHEKMLLEGEV